VAEADAARDQVTVRQSEIRFRQLSNQVRLEIDNALTSMRHARTAYQTAVQARRLQEQSLELEQAKYDAGASTSFFVMQYQTALAQSRSAEVVARSAWVKARAALQRATGSILADSGVAFDQAANR
jgi:outer membrane protein TolC